MNILVTTFLDLDNDRNGVVSVANDLNRLLADAGHRVEIVTPANAESSVVARAVSRMKRLLALLQRAISSPAVYACGLNLTVWDLKRRIAGHASSCDVIIAHDLLSAWAALEAPGADCPVLLFCHFWTEPWCEFSDAGLLPQKSRSFRNLKSLMKKVLSHPRVMLIPVSGRNAALLRRIAPQCGEEKIMTAYPGVTVTAFFNRVGAENTLPVIINVGKLEVRKNQRILPPVAAELLRLGHPCRFVLMGLEEPNEKLHILAEIRELGVHELFTLAGRQSREDVFSAMAQADLYLHTSLSESFGMTLVEAMAAGIPVMALEYDALHEILPDTPEMIIAADATPAEIAAKLSGLLADRSRLAGIRERQYTVFKRRFSSQAFLSRVLEIITTARGQNR